MAYKVTSKWTSPSPHLAAPGEHYVVEDESRDSWFQKISFYRTRGGREVATDALGVPLAEDGKLFQSVKAAVEEYDQSQP